MVVRVAHGSHASISAAVRAERGLPENLIRLCVGIEDPRDLIDDLEHSLVASGAIVPDHSAQVLSKSANEELFATDRNAWILSRAKAFQRPKGSGLEKLAHSIKNTLGFSDRKQLEQEITVSAPGKVILFGEHAVVHGVVSHRPVPEHSGHQTNMQTAVATSVDLRCYSVLSPRNDNKIALEAPELDDLEIEWDISKLPWNLLPLHADGSRRSADKELDPPLLQAIEVHTRGAEGDNRGLGAQVAFLYLYMVIAGSERNA